MDSKERVRRTVCHQQTDRLAKNFLPSALTMQKLKSALNVSGEEAVFAHMGADIRTMDATAWYKNPLRQWRDEEGTLWQETFWGYERNLSCQMRLSDIRSRIPRRLIIVRLSGIVRYTRTKQSWWGMRERTRWRLPICVDRSSCLSI